MSGSPSTLDDRLETLAARGVIIIDPRQTYVAPEVSLERISPGATLYPGTRLEGARTFIGAGAKIGSEGPATVIDAAFAERAEIASGFVSGAVLLADAKLGANAHVRAGTLLEEQASTAHAVGLKQTILLAFVTLGSLINFCDCLMAGGTSRSDHSEVGSGYIHFNFTPWGERGDKATPSLCGDVPRGVLLRERRIFLGGSGGMIGPAEVGYGAIAGAGQVLRADLGPGVLRVAAPRPIDRPIKPNMRDRLQPRLGKNIAYIAQLFALREWYRQVRLARLGPEDPNRPPIEAALEIIDQAIAERSKQLARFAEERGTKAPNFVHDLHTLPPCPWQFDALQESKPGDHLVWVQSLSPVQVSEGRAWLQAIVDRVVTTANDAL
ncbi:MAG: UDP-N-acetylglucosamine pyrophosphorylase [Myxococcales bacterium]|nr:UDP-N-acetylglucosamine pyrophosphorylase [Myxococcales bacterium]